MCTPRSEVNHMTEPTYEELKARDFATLNWPHFDHYIWPHPNR